MRKVCRIACLAVSVSLLSAASATALTVVETRSIGRDFDGEGCGSRSTNHFVVPARARLLSFRPTTGTVIEDDISTEPVARLTSEEVRLGGKRAVRFTAVGSDDACARPDKYMVDGWAVTDQTLSLTVRRKVRVYFRSYIMGTYIRARYRPRTILFGNRTGVQRVRWSRWNGKVARGRGILLYNDCRPNCAQAQPQYFRVAIKLSRPRKCAGRYDYTRFAFRYTGRKPAGLRRAYAERHSCRPSGEVGPP